MLAIDADLHQAESALEADGVTPAGFFSWGRSNNDRSYGPRTIMTLRFLPPVPVVNSIVLAVDRESRDAGSRC